MEKLLPNGITSFSVIYATSMLPSTFWWQIYFKAFTETNSSTIAPDLGALILFSTDQTNSWPMKKP